MGGGFQGAESYDSMGQDIDWAAGDTKAANDPKALDGYDPQVAPDSNWPGLTADPRQVRFDVTAVEALLAQIEGMIPTLQQQTYRLNGEIVQAQFGHPSWPQAENLRVANESVAKGVDTYTGKVVVNLQDAVKAIRTALDTYHQQDAASQAQINRTSSNLNS